VLILAADYLFNIKIVAYFAPALADLPAEGLHAEGMHGR